jgi:hypothetical protein
MPFFWSTAHWKNQYSLDVDWRTEMSINTVKATARLDKKYDIALIGLQAISPDVPKKMTRS